MGPDKVGGLFIFVFSHAPPPSFLEDLLDQGSIVPFPDVEVDCVLSIAFHLLQGQAMAFAVLPKILMILVELYIKLIFYVLL